MGKGLGYIMITPFTNSYVMSREELDYFAKIDKALTIIKKKKIDLEYLKCCETYEQYKTICSYWNEITQKEFDLLKEALL